MVQYRITAADAAAWSAREGVSRRYHGGELLPAVVVTSRSTGRCDLHVFLHGPATAIVFGVAEHYAAEGAWIRLMGK